MSLDSLRRTRSAPLGLLLAAFLAWEAPVPLAADDLPAALDANERWIRWSANDRASAEPTGGAIRHPLDAWLLDDARPALRDLRLLVERSGETRAVPWLDSEALPIEHVPFQSVQSEQAVPVDPALQAAWRSARNGAWPDAIEALRDHPRLEAAALRRWAEDDFDADRLDASRQLLETAVTRLDALPLSPTPAERAADAARLGLTLHRLSSVLLYLGESRTAVEVLERAAPLWRRVAPRTDSLRRTLNNLGVAYQDVGRLHEAQSVLEEALALAREIAPGTLREAAILNNLGSLAYERGDLTASEHWTRGAKDLRQRLAPDSLKLAQSLNNLASLMEEVGELEKAEVWYRRALDLRRRLGGETDEVISTLLNLATLLAPRDDGSEAIELAREALALAEEASSRTSEPWAAKVLAHVLLEARGESADGRSEAIEAARRAVDGFRRLAPDSMAMADALGVLGAAQTHTAASLAGAEANDAREDVFAAAEASLRGALAIRQRRAAGGRWEAASWQALAALDARRGRLASALVHQLHAIELLEARSGPPGETPRERARAAAESVEWYRDASRWSAALGRPDAAFDLAERSRARGLLATLAERRLRFDRDLPSPLEIERQELATRLEATWQDLAEAGDPAAVATTRTASAELRDERQTLERRIREASPRLGALRDPETLDAATVAARLEPGTLLVTWVVGRDDSLLLAVAARSDSDPAAAGESPPLEVHTLPVGRDELARRVDTWRALLERPSPGLETAQQGLARGLWDDLLAPIASHFDDARRLVLVPDRSLHRLPFAALVDPDGRFLIERLPIARAPSATLAANRRASRLPHPGKQRPGSAPGLLAAFGDPRTTEPLAWSRFEVQLLGTLFPGPGLIYVGEQATEKEFKRRAAEADWIHFAGHTEIQDRFPLESYLRLAPGDGETGSLHAWEIFEDLRIDASLVTLSACETSVGRAIDGEGRLGLAQAFLFAGADAVVSSQWRVRDRPTALLMLRFAHHLIAERPVDEALREAQLDLLQDRVRWPGETAESVTETSWLHTLAEWLGWPIRDAAAPALESRPENHLPNGRKDPPETESARQPAAPGGEPHPNGGRDAPLSLEHPGAWASFEVLLGG